MNDSLHRLIYTSHNAIEGDAAAVEAEVQQILSVSRQSNQPLDVTGALMFNAGCFAQVLEGPHDSVQEVFERVQCDFRHENVVVLDSSPIDCRHFDHWSMAYVGEGAAEVDLFAAIARDSHFDAAAVSGERIFDILLAHLHDNDARARARHAA